MTRATSLIREELERFVETYRLTKRERDVLFLLANGYSSVSDIAKQLGVSPNTVRNHFKNVFRKTKTNSKVGVMALFIGDTMRRQADYRLFLKRPRMLVVDDERETCRALARALNRKGVRVHQETDPTRVLERVRRLNFDIVLSDIDMPRRNGFEVLAEIRERYEYNPSIFLMTGHAEISREYCLARGADEIFYKPIAMDDLLFAVFKHFVDSPYERNRLLRVDSELPAQVENKYDVSVRNIGFGGAYLSFSDNQLESEPIFAKGNEISIEFSLEDSVHIVTRGEVVWSRPHPTPATPPGIGIKFLDMNDRYKKQVEEYVKRNRLMGFVPWDTEPN